MISIETKTIVADNSGIRVVKNLNFKQGAQNNRKGTVGNFTVVSIKGYKKGRKVSDRKVFFGAVATVRNWIRRKTGIFFRTNQNRTILFENKEKLLGKILKGPVSLELRKLGIPKIFSLAKFII